MRLGIILAATAALTAMASTGARADKWCGYAAHAKSFVECGYSSVAECENTIGKGGMCFIDPDYALNVKRAAPAIAPTLTAAPG